MSSLLCCHVDAFVAAAAGVKGNPAAVVLIPTRFWGPGGACNEAWMQRVAVQFGLSETAFVSRAESPGNFALRWFTPTKEVALCGHATLATAHALRTWAAWGAGGDEVATDSKQEHGQEEELRALKSHLERDGEGAMRFHTLSGVLSVSTATFNNDDDKPSHNNEHSHETKAKATAAAAPLPLLMHFPYNAPAEAKSHEAKDLYLRIAKATVAIKEKEGDAASVIHSVVFNSRTNKLIVRLTDDCGFSIISGMRRPDPAALLAIDQSHLPKEERVTGVSVTASGASLPADLAASLSPSSPSLSASASQIHFFSRYFSPWNGLPEDPVNGSSHTLLAPYWADALGLWKKLERKESKEVEVEVEAAEMTALQLSAKPAGGVLRLRAVRPTSTSASTSTATSATAPSASLAASADEEDSCFVEIGGLASTVYQGRIAAPTTTMTTPPA